MNASTNIHLEKARKCITEITFEIITLACERLKLMRLIAQTKKESNRTQLPIFHPEREQELREKCRRIAEEKNCDPDMIDRLVYELMSDGKYIQLKLLHRSTVFDTDEIKFSVLRANLRKLTSAIAPTYERYDRHAQGTHVEYLHERRILLDLLENLHEDDAALNLGCATGTFVTNTLSHKLRHVIGYDISRDMVEHARHHYPDNEFHIYDLDDGIPYRKNAAALIVANLGTASELRVNLFSEARRVLKSGGLAYLSFYNGEALATKWWPPQPKSFQSMVNVHNDTVFVPFVDDDKTHREVPIYGKARTADNIHKEAAKHGFEVKWIESSSPLWDNQPKAFFATEDAVAIVKTIDKEHGREAPYTGQYLRTLIKKQ